jgi:hypothetical protein
MPEKRASPRLNIRHVNPAVSAGAMRSDLHPSLNQPNTLIIAYAA